MFEDGGTNISTVYKDTMYISESSTLATLLEAQQLPYDEGVMVHALAAL